MTRALLEQALEALECAYSENYDGAKIHGAKVAIRAHLAQPAWHDAPTVPGLWSNSVNWHVHKVLKETLSAWQHSGARYYGPIPSDSGDRP